MLGSLMIEATTPALDTYSVLFLQKEKLIFMHFKKLKSFTLLFIYDQ